MRPIPPLELALWWIEYVVESGGAPLIQNESRNMHWIVYNSIEVYLICLGILFIVGIGLWKSVKFLTRALCRFKIVKPSKSKQQ